MNRNIMCEASEKGVIVVNKCLEKGIKIDTAKLEQLLILMHGTMLSLYQKPFFVQNVIAMPHALMVDEVDKNFKMNCMGFKEKIPQYICLLQNEEKVMDYIIENYGNLDFFELNIRKDLSFLRELFCKEGEKIIVPNEAIEKVFDYYNFFELDCVKKQEESFQKKLRILINKK